MKFSIIIPTLNEEKTIQSCLLALQPLRPDCQLIVADGDSSDNTKAIALPLADKVINSEKGRSRQMNNGAAEAKGEILIFLHADTYLPDNALQLIRQHTTDKNPWGRFDIQLSGDHSLLKVIALLMIWRSRLSGIATGDQAIFVTKQAFAMAGRYPEIDLMEDIALCKSLKKISPPVCLAAKVISSGRRWEYKGVCRTILLMWTLRLLYFFGADPKTLAHFYRRGSLWKR